MEGTPIIVRPGPYRGNVDSTVAAALISGGVGLVGIGVGYLGGVQKGRADLAVERERTRQLREERSENHLQHRMGTYHNFLNSCTKLLHMYTSGGVTIPRCITELEEIARHLNGVQTYGAKDTHKPADDMYGALAAFNPAVRDTTAYAQARTRFLIAAHTDVGPQSLE